MDQYLEGIKKLFSNYKLLGEKAISQLEPSQLFIQHDDDSNSIAVIIKHMAGNMISRWTDFLTTDGEKPWRNRDSEFVEDVQSKEVLMQKWEAGWNCLFNALNTTATQDLTLTIFIRNEGLTVMDAINRQLAHYAYHVGQIVFYAKQLKQGGWESLSIPKNRSADYNADKFAK